MQPDQRYQEAIQALNRGSWREAQIASMELLRQNSTHAGVHFVAGVAALQLGQVPLALELLKGATRLNASRADYWAQLARAYSQTRSTKDAVAAAERAMALESEDPLTLDTLGVVLTQANEHGKAVEVFRRAAQLMPDRAGFRFNLASSLTFIGELAQAREEYEACLQLNPRYWKAYLALPQLRKQTDSDNHVDRLVQVLKDVGDDVDGLMYLNLALAKELEDLGRYDESFVHLQAGKAAQRVRRAYSTAHDEAIFEAIMASCAPMSDRVEGYGSAEPIFIIGMPRSGTTLVERILSSHSSVHSAGELQNFGVALKRASGTRSNRMLDVETLRASSAVDWTALGSAYLHSTRPSTGHTSHFIDKLPHNFLYAGFIARALPNAKIICLRRDPMDTCLSNFRQLFALTSPYYDYSFDLMDTGRYFLLFDRLMAYWRSTMPGRILEIHYEDIVQSQEGSTRALLEFCGLPWEEACLDFERNAAPVATASAVQVRSPVYRTSMQRWKRYGAHMDGLRKLLQDGGVVV